MGKIDNNAEVRLTQLSHGAGCGCKISPEILEGLIKEERKIANPLLLVGNHTKDDAAVYDIGNGQAIISTTDFFMPIVDDPFDFGAIASVNALSDIYAMGGKPLMAIAILGWPVNDVDPSIASRVLEGSRAACADAGIEVAGGHSIDNPEPIFGLAVTGIVPKTNLKRNNTAIAGSLLYLTKPLGVGLVTTAQKMEIANPDDLLAVTKSMKILNKIGSELGDLEYINAMTDVTGFGLLGHLIEVCESSGLSAELSYSRIPKLENIEYYLENKTIPGGTLRNWNSYKDKVAPINQDWINLLADPQTSGGLLISVDADFKDDFEEFMKGHGFSLTPFGKLVSKKDFCVIVE
jgi:selenide,water dikinase